MMETTFVFLQISIRKQHGLWHVWLGPPGGSGTFLGKCRLKRDAVRWSRRASSRFHRACSRERVKRFHDWDARTPHLDVLTSMRLLMQDKAAIK